MEESNSNHQSKSKALPIFIILFLASLALSAFLFFKYAKNANKIQAQKEELTIAYEALNLRADSLQTQLDFALKQLEDRINENLAQADLKDELRIQLEEKKRALIAAHGRIKRLINGEESSTASSVGGPRNLLEAKNEIASLKQKNSDYIAQVEQAQKQYKVAQDIAKSNELRAEAAARTKDSLAQINGMLQTKLSTASILRIAALNASPIRERKGEQEVVEKAKKVNRIKISFKVLGSELTEKEKKDLVIRILAPNGAVLTEKASRLTDSDELYSLQKSITYDGTEKGVTYYYDQEAEYTKGSYTVELKHNNLLLDKTSFSLR